MKTSDWLFLGAAAGLGWLVWKKLGAPIASAVSTAGHALTSTGESIGGGIYDLLHPAPPQQAGGPDPNTDYFRYDPASNYYLHFFYSGGAWKYRTFDRATGQWAPPSDPAYSPPADWYTSLPSITPAQAGITGGTGTYLPGSAPVDGSSASSSSSSTPAAGAAIDPWTIYGP